MGLSLPDGAPAQAPDIFDTLKILADPATFSARLEALKAAEQAANEAVALVGPANEITHLHEVATADQLNAAQTLADAQSKAQFLADTAAASTKDAQAQAHKIIQAAQDQAAQIMADVQKRAMAVQAQSDALGASLAAQQAQADQITAQARAQADEASARHAEAEQALSEAMALKESFTAKIQAFQALAKG